MKKIALSILALLFVGLSSSVAQDPEKQIVVKDRKNDKHQIEKPYVILVSLDGFRSDYIEKHGAEFLKKFGEMGVKAESMLPSFPSVTFPNHYTVVTGMYPIHHGLVGNNMFDRKTGDRYSLRNSKAIKDAKWYGGKPLWVLAEQQGMLSACYYWPGSEADIQGAFPTYSYAYSEKTPINLRLKEIAKWLDLPEYERPHFITFYMPEVDSAGHKYGPDAKETQEAVQYVDKAMEDLYEIIKNSNLPINLIIVSDHGMIEINQDMPLKLPIEINDDELDVVVNGVYISLFAKDQKYIDQYYKNLKRAVNNDFMEVYLADEVPEELNFNKKNDNLNRIGDIVVVAKAPYYFTNNTPPVGSHGYDPKKVKEMHSIFLAYGPNFVKNAKIDSFENIHIYPMITRMLDLDYDRDSIDGKEEILESIIIK